MRNIVGLGLLLIAILISACGSNGSKGSSEPTESALRERVEAVFAALGDENWIEAHRFSSPEFQEACPAEKFAIASGEGMKAIKGILGLDEDEKFQYRVIAVTVDGRNGAVTSEILYEGEPLIFGEAEAPEPKPWVFNDGQWWPIEGDASKGCLGL